MSEAYSAADEFERLLKLAELKNRRREAKLQYETARFNFGLKISTTEALDPADMFDYLRTWAAYSITLCKPGDVYYVEYGRLIQDCEQKQTTSLVEKHLLGRIFNRQRQAQIAALLDNAFAQRAFFGVPLETKIIVPEAESELRQIASEKSLIQAEYSGLQYCLRFFNPPSIDHSRFAN